MDEETVTIDSQSTQETSLDNWGKQLMESILLTAAEEVGERLERSDSIEVTLTFRLKPIISKDHIEVSVGFKRDPTLITYIPRQL
jgi:hypothetical protein